MTGKVTLRQPSHPSPQPRGPAVLAPGRAPPAPSPAACAAFSSPSGYTRQMGLPGMWAAAHAAGSRGASARVGSVETGAVLPGGGAHSGSSPLWGSGEGGLVDTCGGPGRAQRKRGPRGGQAGRVLGQRPPSEAGLCPPRSCGPFVKVTLLGPWLPPTQARGRPGLPGRAGGSSLGRVLCSWGEAG